MYCQKCGKENPSTSAFCSHCGSSLVEDKAKNTPNQNDVLANLRLFKKHKNCLCLECGYSGLMGIVKKAPLTSKEKRSIWGARALSIVIFLFGLSQGAISRMISILISVFLWLSYDFKYDRKVLFCPACKTEITENE